MKRIPIPPSLGEQFTTRDALALGLTHTRLRRADLDAPFHGVRVRKRPHEDPPDRYRLARDRELGLMQALATRLDRGQFFTHRSAALIWGAPIPHRERPELHVGVINPQRSPRLSGVHGHCFEPGRVVVQRRAGLPVASPGHAFAMLGALPLAELVAVGDFLVRVHRPGVGRRDVGRAPLASIADLAAAVALGRWRGAQRLREALHLVRLDSWSPRESTTRVLLVTSGLPEPELNLDVFDEHGCFIACVDMVYPRYRVIVEYHGDQHRHSYAEDIERVERLRAAGWTVIQVTRALAAVPHELVARVREALRANGWR